MDTARAILALFDGDRRSIQALGRPAGTALQVHEALQNRPLLNVATAAQLTGLSLTTVSTSFTRMTDLGIVRELTGRRRDRLFAYGPYLDLLAQGTEPIG